MDRRSMIQGIALGGMSLAGLVQGEQLLGDDAEERLTTRISFDEALELGSDSEEALKAAKAQNDPRFRTYRFGLGQRGPRGFSVDIDGLPEGFVGVAGYLTEFSGHVGAAVIRTSSVQIHPSRRFMRVVGDTGGYAQSVSFICILFRV